MANTNAPFGFRQYRGLGSAPTYEQSVRLIKSDNTTAVYFGDPVSNLNTGYITRATAGTAQVSGVFAGCKYLSTSQKRTVWSNYWPGSDVASSNTVEGYIINDPNAKFVVQSDGTGIVAGDVNLNIGYDLGTGNTNTGISGAFATGAANTATLPFRIVGLLTQPPGSPGTASGAYNRIIVAFNNVATKSLTGI